MNVCTMNWVALPSHVCEPLRMKHVKLWKCLLSWLMGMGLGASDSVLLYALVCGLQHSVPSLHL